MAEVSIKKLDIQHIDDYENGNYWSHFKKNEHFDYILTRENT